LLTRNCSRKNKEDVAEEGEAEGEEEEDQEEEEELLNLIIEK